MSVCLFSLSMCLFSLSMCLFRLSLCGFRLSLCVLVCPCVCSGCPCVCSGCPCVCSVCPCMCSGCPCVCSSCPCVCSGARSGEGDQQKSDTTAAVTGGKPGNSRWEEIKATGGKEARQQQVGRKPDNSRWWRVEVKWTRTQYFVPSTQPCWGSRHKVTRCLTFPHLLQL